jgi:hypothetical protein
MLSQYNHFPLSETSVASYAGLGILIGSIIDDPLKSRAVATTRGFRSTIAAP